MGDQKLFGTHIYRTELVSEENDNEASIIISKVDSFLFFMSHDKRQKMNALDSHLNLIRKRCTKKITFLQFQGVEYSIFQDMLHIQGLEGCAKELSKSALNVLSEMPIFEPKGETVTKFSCEKGFYNTTTWSPSTSHTETGIKEVVSKGHFKVIPEHFFSLYRSGELEYSDSLHVIHPETIDLSQCDVQEMGSLALHVSGVKKVILPTHPVYVQTMVGYTPKSALGLEDSVVIENEEYLRDAAFSGCCIVA